MFDKMDKALKWSLALHGGVLAACLCWGLVSWVVRKPVEPVHVFQLAGVQSPTQAQSPAASQPAPQPAQQEPRPTPPQPVQQPPKPAQPLPTRTAPAQQAQPKPRPMTYEEFRRQNRLPAQQQPKPAPRPSPPKPAPVVDASAVVRDLRSNLTRDDGQPVTGMSTADQNALYDYFQHVRALIDSGFRRPSGIVDSAKAMVEFRIKADGTVDSIRIVSSSGNKAFDDAALAAVRSIGRLSPPPGRTAYTRRIEFVADSGAR